MSDELKHSKQFSANDFERYYNGQMTAKEMHELEKAALDDPFLAEALEGYEQIKKPSEDVRVLQSDLEKRTGSSKVVGFAPRKNGKLIWKIAALFVLIIGAGWLAYQFSISANPSHSIVHVQEKDTQQKNSATTFQPTKTPESSPSSTLKIKEEKQPATITNQVRIKTKTKRTVIAFHPPKNKQEFSSDTTNNNLLANTNQSIKSLKADTESVALNQAPKALFNKRISESDSLADVTVIGYGAQRRRAAASQPDDAQRKSEAAQLNEVIVLKNKIDTSANKKPKITFEEAEPVNGTTNFDDYITENLQMPEALKIKPDAGVVKLSFDVNEAGEPVNIKVEKSLCEACDKEAIRLLKEGPKWIKKKKNKKGKLTIRF